jgi:hypothetical protein
MTIADDEVGPGRRFAPGEMTDLFGEPCPQIVWDMLKAMPGGVLLRDARAIVRTAGERIKARRLAESAADQAVRDYFAALEAGRRECEASAAGSTEWKRHMEQAGQIKRSNPEAVGSALRKLGLEG